MRLKIFKESAVRAPVSGLTRLFELIIKDEARPHWSGVINVVFTDNRRIRQLNRQFRSRDVATDVLSFTIDEPDDSDGVYGEIYISVPFARKQADSYQGNLREEILRLFCHGMLHLFGYDHEKSSDARRMSSREESYLRLVTGKRG